MGKASERIQFIYPPTHTHTGVQPFISLMDVGTKPDMALLLLKGSDLYL